MGSSKKVILSVTNDLETDQRLHKICSSLIKHGYSVQLVGRRLSYSRKIEFPFPYKRFSLWFNSGPLFYLNYNLRLLIFLLFTRADILIANDLDTLTANFLASKIKGKPLVYDSHEYFTEVPELINRKKVRDIWLRMESYLLPRLKYAYTVSEKVAESYSNKYGLKMEVIRNFPKELILDKEESEEDKEGRTIIYQGALNIGRGLEELIEAINLSEGLKLIIAGTGDIDQSLRTIVKQNNLESRVVFLGRVEPEQLKSTTKRAMIGVSLEKPMGLNYQYALPNKVFDYIHAEVPVLYSPLSEIVSVLSEFKVGEELVSHEPESIAKQLENMLSSDNYIFWQDECRKAAKKLNWESEEKKLIALIKSIND